ncbi:NAD-dependent epimerase/dehydratase family protein, partial [Xanthovirga aplysinae]|uniref:NAD-dependent epimerase/dehydratase family protein n=1 Tax=Xanthovirga aplysinae TaxID=2529853 RepID=UPI0012BB4A5F
GGGGFIGGHLVSRLKSEGYWVRVCDLKHNDFAPSLADNYVIGDLTNPYLCKEVVKSIDEIYQLAAHKREEKSPYAGEVDASSMYNSATVNLNIVEAARRENIKKIFYASSTDVYSALNYKESANLDYLNHSSDSAFPAYGVGWEVLFSERLFLSYCRSFNMDVKIGRIHNIYGPQVNWIEGNAKGLTGICRKVAMAPDGGNIEFLDEDQNYSYLHVNDCIEGIRRQMESDYVGPFTLASENQIKLRDLINLVVESSGKSLEIEIKNRMETVGRGNKCTEYNLLWEKLSWKPLVSLRKGIQETYLWIRRQIEESAKKTC